MSTNIHRHTARPSRSRVIRARVSAWIDRHSDALTAIAVGALVVILTTLTALALISDGISTADAIGASAVSLSCVIFATFFAHVLTDDRTSRRVYRRWASNHARAREEWHKYCDQMATRYEEQNARNIARRNDALNDRDLALREMRNARRECDRMARELATSGERMAASYDITKVERDALESENANLVALIRALISPTFADATREELRVWIWAGNSESAYADAFYNGEGVSLDDEITRRAAYEMAERANARK